MNFSGLTIRQLHQGLLDKKFSASEICKFYLKQIANQDKKINAFLEVDEESALSQAKAVDGMVEKGDELSMLAGIPCAVKDNIMVQGFKCTAGSRILESFQAVYDGFCVKKLKEQSAVILGKTNLDEFAMGSSTERSAFKITKNPCDLSRVPGGSSGGSAAAVASNEAVFSLGSDTGGSIRQPASFCGVVGLKPTYGAVSRYGLIAFASSLDQIGPFAKTVEDAEIIFNAIRGRDEMDSTSINYQLSPADCKLKDIKIGIPKEYFGEGIELEVKKAIDKVIKKLESEGADIIEISLPHTKYALACYYIIATSEASANLARFDGIKYGKSEIQNLKSKTANLLEVYTRTREEGFGDEVKRRIMLGTFVLSSGYYDAYYLRAQKVRTLIKRDFDNAFEKVNFLLTPVSPFPAFKIGEKIDDPLKMYLSDICTVSVNLAGLPAMSVSIRSTEGPALSKVEGLPNGLQIIAKPFDEAGIFELSKLIEKLIM